MERPDCPAEVVDRGRRGDDRFGDGRIVAIMLSHVLIIASMEITYRDCETGRFRCCHRLDISYGGDEVTDEAAAAVSRAASDTDASKIRITGALDSAATVETLEGWAIDTTGLPTTDAHPTTSVGKRPPRSVLSREATPSRDPSGSAHTPELDSVQISKA